MAQGSRRMVSGRGRIACAIAALLLCAGAMGHAAAATRRPPARTKPAAATNAPNDKICLPCHNLKANAKLQARPVSVYVNAETFQPSVHSTLGCVSCHSDIHAFPH